MSDPNLSEPDSPPPPAYEFCQEEFDQKVAHALEASQSEPQRSADEEEEWEAWNESVFEAAVAQLTLSDTQEASSSRSPTTASASASASHSRTFSGAEGNDYGAASSSSNNPENGVQPLRIVKKLSVKEKERPSWYAEAQLAGDHPTSQDASVITNHPRSSLRRADTYIERQQTPPPMFTDIGPSLDGPPYEGLVLTYVPGDSNPPSPLQSPRPTSIFGDALPPPPPLSPPASSTHRRSLPQPPIGQINSPPVSGGQVHRISPKPPTISPSINYPAPRVTFNPQVAYSNLKSSNRSGEESHLPQRIDAASFYNFFPVFV
ncbi:hypothetical protein PHLCEN_2v10681 [Hermanssonia centrifuga]|uniref:Uncharacterized protein n=1 Tax=Hermanssonia centrifuga TaxID=98765 RepID=A0A2R6NM25_9APHY|nr:hypothetical protein PHLCEN_2v10681 [Hermanssonia centrifuga]